MPPPKPLLAVLRRRFSYAAATTATPTPKPTTPQKLTRIPNVRTYYKSKAMEEAQRALREYLYDTRSLPFIFAELIAQNSLFSLSNLIRKIQFCPRTFSKSFRRLLGYEPINEFEFFLESIGIDYDNVHGLLPPKEFFFSENRGVLDAALALSRFGFPWNRLGKLYQEEVLIFSKSPDELTARLRGFSERYGFDCLYVVGLCLAFPRLLSAEGEFGCDVDEIFGDLKRVFVEFDVQSCVEGNVDAWYEVCCKVRVFYDLGCEKGKVGELMCDKKEVFLRCPKEVLVQKADYFTRFGVRRVDVGMLLLRRPEIMSLDLETQVISVSGLLKRFALSAEELQRVSQKYPHVFGRNKMANLPHVMRALDLHEWFFERLKSSNGHLLATYALSCFHEDIDEVFVDALKRIELSKCHSYTLRKIDFLTGIGFGENASCIKTLKFLEASGTHLQERFDSLLRLGLKHSSLCLMIRSAPNILNNSPEKLEQKVNFLLQEMGSSLEYLHDFPGFLFFDFENRIKRRYKFYIWFREAGLSTKKYSIASMLQASDKKFIQRIFEIHPAAPKRYLEFFSYERPMGYCK